MTFPDPQLIEKLSAVAGESSKSSRKSAEIDIQWMKTGYVGVPLTAKLILSSDFMELVETGGAKKLAHFKVPADQFVNIGTAAGAGNVSDPVYTTQVLHFSSDLKQAGGPRGKKLYPGDRAASVYVAKLSLATQPPEIAYGELRFTRRSGVPISKLIVTWLHALTFALSGVALLCASGCVIVPVRLPVQTKDTAGKLQKLDFTFLKSGSTTREEVTKNLAAIDTGVKQNDFFWGRWDSSTWGYGGFVAMPPSGGAGGTRVWGIRNLLVAFDQKGMVKSWAVVDDTKLDQQVDLLDSAPLDLSSPVRATAHVPFIRHGDDNKPATATADLVLTAESFECDNVQTSRANITAYAKCDKAKIPRANIVNMTPISEFSNDGYLGYLWFKMHFAKPAPVAYYSGATKAHFQKFLLLGVDPPTFLLIRRYLKQTKEK